ncbi:Glycosyl hydrolases family 2, TIM barrel domain [Arenibacter palladensis]|uniref:Glycosyl hydrolases family 2, TIM barrel domain n=1 Tax=Arenibacter palladensis TaxID=237373 RepID=A0A1M4W588_9FLAO|nr:sugar-binding domain-containing protein [Arenibacter palladensis]SHE76428.1 Glycosyl hydrolases family 2, TIM barrel domain [Arenibacter palladensis]
MKFKVLILPILFLVFCSCEKEQTKEIDLSGEWQFQIDSLDQGITGQWYAKNLFDNVQLPGSMAENGKGNDITVDTHWTGSMWNDSLWYKDPKYAKYREPGNVKVSFWLSPEKVYYGPAWYQKKVSIPESWKKQHINLYLERAHWETTVWIDEQKVGVQNSLGTPHDYNLSDYLTPGEHTITIRVDNRVKDIDPGVDAHSISDNTQTNWNGIVGDIKLTASSPIIFQNIKLYPNVTDKMVTVKGQVSNSSGSSQKCKILLQVREVGHTKKELQKVIKEIEIDAEGQFEIEYAMGDSPLLWDEFNPNLYNMQLRLESEQGIDQKEVTFGMRDFEVDGKHFAINGRPVFLRGTLECSIFPLTGYPPTNVEEWKRILKTIQNYGLNHMRFHSYCPPEAAFQAADELGVYIQVEASAWANIGDGKPIDQWIYKEAEAIINSYGNHPSFVMMAYGNEPSGENHEKYLEKFVEYFKKLDNRRLYTSGAGWPLLDNLDYYNHKGPRIQGWAQELNSIINAEPPQTEFDYDKLIQETPMPYVSHEMGQWCAYPNFKEMSKYTGVLKPKNFEIFKETLEDNHLGHLADSLLLASGKLQVLCYKADIEAALRTKDMAGFQLLDLHDFPGQGTALVGVLDAFWDEKGYVTADEFREFNSETVPLARLAKRIFMNNETLKAVVEVAHYGERPLNDIIPTWELSDKNGVSYAKGEFPKTNIPMGNGYRLGEISVDLNTSEKAQKLVLTVVVGKHENSWDLWVYPSQNEPIVKANQIMVVQKFDTRTINYLKNGGNVLLNITKGDIAPKKGGDIGVGFSSIFWNTSWTNGQKPHTLGILTNPKHPALAEFPTEYHSNWQWWDAMTHSNAMVLDDFTPDLKPIVRIVDDWFENRRTALLFEVKVGKGKLLISGIDLHTDLERRPEARQLLYSLKKYISSDKFNPEIKMDSDDIKSLFTY